MSKVDLPSSMTFLSDIRVESASGRLVGSWIGSASGSLGVSGVGSAFGRQVADEIGSPSCLRSSTGFRFRFRLTLAAKPNSKVLKTIHSMTWKKFFVPVFSFLEALADTTRPECQSCAYILRTFEVIIITTYIPSIIVELFSTSGSFFTDTSSSSLLSTVKHVSTTFSDYTIKTQGMRYLCHHLK